MHSKIVLIVNNDTYFFLMFYFFMIQPLVFIEVSSLNVSKKIQFVTTCLNVAISKSIKTLDALFSKSIKTVSILVVSSA